MALSSNQSINQSLFEIAAHCKKLKILDISNGIFLCRNEFKILMSSNKSLIYLDASYSDIRDEDLLDVKDCMQPMQTLILCCTSVTSTGIQAVKIKNPKLTIIIEDSLLGPSGSDEKQNYTV